MSLEAGVSLENDEDDVRGPAHESQNHAAAQEEPVIVVVVDQALQRVRDQSLALGNLVGGTGSNTQKHEGVLLVAAILFQILHTNTLVSLFQIRGNLQLHHTSPAESGFWPYG